MNRAERNGRYTATEQELISFIETAPPEGLTKEQKLVLMDVTIVATAFIAATDYCSFSGTTVLRKLLEAREAMIRAFAVDHTHRNEAIIAASEPEPTP